MRVGAIQSCYIPWRGYFDFIASVDCFVIYDDVQYSKGSWRNRNRIKTPAGLSWISVPVQVHGWPMIDEVPINNAGKSWQNQHRELLRRSLGNAPFFDDVIRLWEDGEPETADLLSPLNRKLIQLICEYLEIGTPLMNSRQFHLQTSGTQRLIDMLIQMNADCYLSGPNARCYLDEDLFRQSGIRLEYKSYDYAPYPQLHGEFEGAVTVLDLIANLGANAKSYLRSQSPAVVAVS